MLCEGVGRTLSMKIKIRLPARKVIWNLYPAVIVSSFFLLCPWVLCPFVYCHCTCHILSPHWNFPRKQAPKGRIAFSLVTRPPRDHKHVFCLCISVLPLEEAEFQLFLSLATPPLGEHEEFRSPGAARSTELVFGMDIQESLCFPDDLNNFSNHV